MEKLLRKKKRDKKKATNNYRVVSVTPTMVGYSGKKRRKLRGSGWTKCPELKVQTV